MSHWSCAEVFLARELCPSWINISFYLKEYSSRGDVIGGVIVDDNAVINIVLIFVLLSINFLIEMDLAKIAPSFSRSAHCIPATSHWEKYQGKKIQ
jgi:hypothetical protein